MAIKCPNCEKNYLKRDFEEDLCTCSCGYSKKPYETLEDYRKNVLKISYRDISQGADNMIYTHPECDMEMSLYDSENRKYICFECLEVYNALQCGRCGELMSESDSENAVCSDCFNDVIEEN